jgi:hypothetical protein
MWVYPPGSGAKIMKFIENSSDKLKREFQIIQSHRVGDPLRVACYRQDAEPKRLGYAK